MGVIKRLVPVEKFAGVAEIEVFWDRDWKGERWRESLDVSYTGDHWNDEISSIIVYSGTWRFFADADFAGQSWDLGPGQYAFVGDHGIANDTISSWKRIG